MSFVKKILFFSAALSFVICKELHGDLSLIVYSNEKTSFSFKLNKDFESISENINYSLNYFIQVNDSFTPDLNYTIKSYYMLDEKLVPQFEFGLSKSKEINLYIYTTKSEYIYKPARSYYILVYPPKNEK